MRYTSTAPFMVFHAGVLVNPDRTPNFKNIALIESIYGGLEFAARRATVTPRLEPGAIVALADNETQRGDVNRMLPVWTEDAEILMRRSNESPLNYLRRVHDRICAPFVILPEKWKDLWPVAGSKTIELDMR